jgi:SAM-dependent methyltransferase
MINNKAKSLCPICGCRSLIHFLSRKQVPVHQNLLFDEQESATKIARGDLELIICEACGFIFNQAFDPSKLSYGEAYDNTQTWSPAFDEYLDGLTQYLMFERSIQNCRVVEVGCGKGQFLKKLIGNERAGNSGYGFDPSYAGPASEFNGRLQFRKCYYGPECADIVADVVICRHVIEHIPEPLSLLRTIRQTMTGASPPRIFFETPCVEWILRNQVIWDFFYEHCSYFSAASLTTAFEAVGFRVEKVHQSFGDQYLWLEAGISIERPTITKQPGSIPLFAKQFAIAEGEVGKVFQEKVENLAARGRIALWGAGAKGVTFANLVDPERKWITCVVDLNPQKHGHYLPGTGHQIVDYRELADYGVTAAILMNPNYREENLALLHQANLHIDLIAL